MVVVSAVDNDVADVGCCICWLQCLILSIYISSSEYGCLLGGQSSKKRKDDQSRWILAVSVKILLSEWKKKSLRSDVTLLFGKICLSKKIKREEIFK